MSLSTNSGEKVLIYLWCRPMNSGEGWNYLTWVITRWAVFSCPGSSIPDLGQWLTEWLPATLEFRHKEWLLRHETLQTFDQSDVWTKTQKDRKTERQKYKKTKRQKDKKTKRQKVKMTRDKKTKRQKDKKTKRQTGKKKKRQKEKKTNRQKDKKTKTKESF